MSEVLHMVMWKFKSTTAEENASQAKGLVEDFQAVKSFVPGLLEVHAGANALAVDGAFDFAISMRFATWADLETYNQHPEHQKIKIKIRDMRIERAQVDFELAV